MPKPAAGIKAFCVKELSVIVLSYNHPQLTASTLKSASVFFPSEDIFVVHNGSMEKHQRAVAEQFSQVNHLILEKNRGFSGGANFGLRAASKASEWILFLTNDCELESVGQIPSGPGVYVPQIRLRKTGRVDSIGGRVDLRSGQLRHCKTVEDFEYAGESIPYAPGTAFLIHRSVIEKGFLFEESYGTYWEDVEFSIRLKHSGVRVSAASDWIIRHGVGKTCHKDPYYSLYLFQRNRKKVSWRYSHTKEKPLLGIALARDWIRISFQLMRQKRYKDLRLLGRAIWD